MPGKLFALIFVCMLFAGGARARGEHLEPEASVFTRIAIDADDDFLFEYEKTVVTAFEKERARELEHLPLGPTAAVIVMPARTNEFRIALTADQGTYRISWARPEIMIWAWLNGMKTRARLKANPDTPIGKMSKEEYAQYRKKFLKEVEDYPERLEDIKVERCEREVRKALAKKLFRIWTIMLRDVRYRDDDHTLKNDGADYHFTLHSYYHLRGMGGQVWSPPRESMTGRLVAITDTMRDYCQKGGAKVTRKLKRQADDLLKRLTE